MKPRAPVRPPTATGSNLPSGSDVFRSSQADGVNPAASVTRTRANRLPARTISSASGTPMNISDATNGAVVMIPSLQAARRHPAGRSTLYPSSVFVYRVRPAATVAVGVGVGTAVVGTTPVAVGVGVGPEPAGEHDARRIAEIIKAFISTPILMAPHRLRSRCLSSPHGPTAAHAAEEVRDARQTIERVRGEVVIRAAAQRARAARVG